LYVWCVPWKVLKRTRSHLGVADLMKATFVQRKKRTRNGPMDNKIQRKLKVKNKGLGKGSGIL